MLEVAKAHTYGKQIDSATKRREYRTHFRRSGRVAGCNWEDAGAQRGRQSQLDVPGGISRISAISMLAWRAHRPKPASSCLRSVSALAPGVSADHGAYDEGPERDGSAAVVGLDITRFS